MKRILKIILIGFLGTTCATDLSPYPQATVSAEVTEAVPSSEEIALDIYDADPNHIWNRVFHPFYGLAVAEIPFESIKPSEKSRSG